MAQYLTEVFGDKLDVSSITTDPSGLLPSPEDLKGKILIKVTLETNLFYFLQMFIQKQQMYGHFQMMTALMV